MASLAGSRSPTTWRNARSSITKPSGTGNPAAIRRASPTALPPHEASASSTGATTWTGLYRVTYDLRVTRAVCLLVVVALGGIAWADDSKLAKEDVPLQHKANLRGKNKLCCGYPLVNDSGWALRFYYLALEEDYQDARVSAIPKADAMRRCRTTRGSSSTRPTACSSGASASASRGRCGWRARG